METNGSTMKRLLNKNNDGKQIKLDKSLSELGFRKSPPHKNISPNYLREPKTISKQMISSSAEDIAMAQTRNLLAQNNQLTSLLHERTLRLQLLQSNYNRQLQQQMQFKCELQKEKSKFMNELAQIKYCNQLDIEELRNQIVRLKEEKDFQEKLWERKIREGKEAESRGLEENSLKIKSMEETCRQRIQLIIIDNQALKKQLQSREKQIQTIVAEHKATLALLRQQIGKLEQTVANNTKLHHLKISQLKQLYESKLQASEQSNRRQKELAIENNQTQIDHLTHTLEEKSQDLQAATTQLSNIESQRRCQQFQQSTKQTELSRQLQDLKAHYRGLLSSEREKWSEMHEEQKNMILTSHRQAIEQLAMQNNRLISICELKNSELEKLNQHVVSLRENQLINKQISDKFSKGLKEQLNYNNIIYSQQNEHNKVKLAQLREADIKALRDYYENQTTVLADTVAMKEEFNRSTREKLINQLRVKQQLRKHFEVETLKYKQQMKRKNIEIAGLKQEISELQQKASEDRGIQIDQLKNNLSLQQISQLHREEATSLQAIIIAKDKELQQLEDRLRTLKVSLKEELRERENQIDVLQNKFKQADSDRIQEKLFYEGELEKLKEVIKKMKQSAQLSAQLVAEARRKAQQNEKYAELEIARLTETINRLQISLRRAQEQREIDKSVSHQERVKEQNSLTKLKQFNQIQMQQTTSRLNAHYTQIIQQKNIELVDLKQLLAEHENDLRDARQNYRSIQCRLQQLLQSQSTLREFEAKITQIGRDNNLVKNKAEFL